MAEMTSFDRRLQEARDRYSNNPSVNSRCLIKFFESSAPPVGTTPTGIGATEAPYSTQEFTFRINPTSLKVVKPKIQSWVLTKAGYERQFWGNDLIKFSYEGSSGVFLPTNEESHLQSRFDIRKSAAWNHFMMFDDFYRRSGTLVIKMAAPPVYEATVFEGALDNFTFALDSAKNPKQILYSLEFTAIPLDYPRIYGGSDANVDWPADPVPSGLK